MGRFGTSVADSQSSDTWILGFKDGVTRIRICQELPTWVKYTQHYSDHAFYYPHDKEPDDGECIGCAYPEYFNDKTGLPREQVQYAFNALDEDGKPRIFRLGIDAFKILKSRHDRLGTLMDRDHNIVRSGKALNTTYIPEPGDKYEIDIPTDLLDIYAALDAKYKEAKQKLRVKIEDGTLTRWSGIPGDTGPADEAQTAKPALKAVKTEAPTQEPKTSTSNEIDFEDMATPDIKGFLEERKVDIPPRAARAALIKLAEENRETAPF